MMGGGSQQQQSDLQNVVQLLVDSLSQRGPSQRLLSPTARGGAPPLLSQEGASGGTALTPLASSFTPGPNPRFAFGLGPRFDEAQVKGPPPLFPFPPELEERFASVSRRIADLSQQQTQGF